MKKLILSLLFFAYLTSVFSVKTFAYYHRHYSDYPFISVAYWDYATAKWDVDGYASMYEISLFRNGHRVTTRTVYGQKYDFSGYILRSNYDYWFEVRPYNEYTGWGKWVSSSRNYSGDWCIRESEYRYPRNLNPYDVSYAVNQGPPINNQANNSYNFSNNTVNNFISNGNANTYGVSVIVPNPQIVYDDEVLHVGTFMQVNGECYFAYLNGVFARNIWLKSNGKWYYFDTTGTMIRGFYTINGSTYYLNEDGSMATGTTKVNGTVHYFDNNGIMIY